MGNNIFGLLDAIKAFEERNNISVAIILCSDGSGSIEEFWHNEELERFESFSELLHILTFVNYQKSFGLCVYPIVRE